MTKSTITLTLLRSSASTPAKAIWRGDCQNDEVVSTDTLARGSVNYIDLAFVREQMNVPRGERYELCRSVHAEANAIINCRERMLALPHLAGIDLKTTNVQNANPVQCVKDDH